MPFCVLEHVSGEILLRPELHVKSQSFFCDYLLPELLTHNFKEKKVILILHDDDKIYCFCKQETEKNNSL